MCGLKKSQKEFFLEEKIILSEEVKKQVFAYVLL